MGDYVTAADVETRYASELELSHVTDDETTGTPDPVVVNEAIDGAEGLANSYIGKRYLLPYDTTLDVKVAGVLKTFVLDLVVYQLAKRQPAIPQSIIDSRVEAIDYFERIADGRVVLPSTATPPSTRTDEPMFQSGTAGTGTTSNRKFTRDTQSAL